MPPQTKDLLPQGHNAKELQKRNANDIDYHQKEWGSGSRGGGSVPADLTWSSNPKQFQEENGSAALKIPAEIVRESGKPDPR